MPLIALISAWAYLTFFIEGRNIFGPLGIIITWHRAVECLVFSQQLCNLHSSITVGEYDDIVVSCCDKQHFYVSIVLLVNHCITLHYSVFTLMVNRLLIHYPDSSRLVANRLTAVSHEEQGGGGHPEQGVLFPGGQATMRAPDSGSTSSLTAPPTDPNTDPTTGHPR